MLHSLLTSLPFMTDTRAQLVIDAFMPLVKSGLAVSVPLTIASFIAGMILATIVALVRVMPRAGTLHRAILVLLHTYISVIRGTPMVVQLAVVFYGLPAMGVLTQFQPQLLVFL